MEIIGIVNQFDSSLPYNDGYQLLPRRAADISLSTGVQTETSGELPRQFQLLQNHPNPFWRETEIRFSLSTEATVQLEIFNLLGERVALLVDKKLAAGEHRRFWNGNRINGQNVAGGIYFYRLHADNKDAPWTAVKKMVVLL